MAIFIRMWRKMIPLMQLINLICKREWTSCPSSSKLSLSCPCLRLSKSSACTQRDHLRVSRYFEDCLGTCTNSLLVCSFLLGAHFQVDDHLLKHRRPLKACRTNLSQPVDCHLRNRCDLDSLLFRGDSCQLQLGYCQCVHGGFGWLLVVQEDVSA